MSERFARARRLMGQAKSAQQVRQRAGVVSKIDIGIRFAVLEAGIRTSRRPMVAESLARSASHQRSKRPHSTRIGSVGAAWHPWRIFLA
jgi:hypothetical protein